MDTIRKEDVRKIEAFEMWIWRKMERISWTEKITNEKVLRREEWDFNLILLY